MPAHDYSDSDDERPSAGPSISTDSEPVSLPPKSTGPRVKLTFRPNLTHLIHEETPSEGSTQHVTSERSSLSPPPPLTLKLGRHPQRIVDRAQHSDSSDDEGSVTNPNNPKRPSKKPKVGSSPKRKTVENGANKKYDWLVPSNIGASHHGPPERTNTNSPLSREKEIEKERAVDRSDTRRLSGWAPGEEYVSQVSTETKKKKSDKPPGLGKAWRKGIKKGMPMPTREDIIASTPGDATPITQGTPEPDLSVPRQPSPPFVKADPSVLGIPIFKKPILPPKFNLSTFPKVSPVFSPINGGDVGPFPRKEPVRRWKMKQRVLVGIGGSALKFNTWSKDGPPSELGRLVREDKEARELNLKRAKANPERPVLSTAVSSESTPTFTSNLAISFTPQEEPGDNTSEIGDEESVSSLTFNETPTGGIPPKRKPKGPKQKQGPRKSKLGQEIIAGPEVVSASDAIEDIM